jgi:hypothetical protein
MKHLTLLTIAALAGAAPTEKPPQDTVAVCDRDSCSVAVVIRRIKRAPPDPREDCTPRQNWGILNTGPATYIETPLNTIHTIGIAP